MASGDRIRAEQLTLNGAAQQLKNLTRIQGNAATLVIRNNSAAADLAIGHDNTVTASGATGGFILGPREAISVDVLSSQNIWVIGTNGQTISILAVY